MIRLTIIASALCRSSGPWLPSVLHAGVPAMLSSNKGSTCAAAAWPAPAAAGTGCALLLLIKLLLPDAAWCSSALFASSSAPRPQPARQRV